MYKIKRILIITLLFIITLSISSCTKNERKTFVNGVIKAKEKGYYNSDKNVLINTTTRFDYLFDNKTKIVEASFYGDINDLNAYESGITNNFIIKKTETLLSNGVVDEINNIELFSNNNKYYYRSTKLTKDGEVTTSYGGKNNAYFYIYFLKSNAVNWNYFLSPDLFDDYLKEPYESGMLIKNSIELNNNKLTFATATQFSYFSSSFVDVYFLKDYKIDKINGSFNTIMDNTISNYTYTYEHVNVREINVPNNPNIVLNLDNKVHDFAL